MTSPKEKQEISLLGRIFSMEALLVLMGIVSLVYGATLGGAVHIFWGVMILVGICVLMLVRKKDWKKHWQEEEERMQRLRGKRNEK